MRICFLGVADWANECNRISRAINKAGTDLSARCVTQAPHPFGYPEDIVIQRGDKDTQRANAAVACADILVTTGDGDYSGFDAMRAEYGGFGKPVCAMHVGTAYRQRPHDYDAMDRARGWTRRFVSPDLYRFVKGDKDARIYLIPHDELVSAPPPREGNTLRVLHAPSNPALKGTAAVEEGLRRAAKENPNICWRTITGQRVSVVWAAMKECDVFVDHLFESHGGIGGAFQEACSYGLAAVSDIRMIVPEVERFMERPPGLCVGDATGVEKVVLSLARSPTTLLANQHRCLGWAERNLSPAAIARYWKENLP